MPTLQLQDALLFGVPILLSASTLAWMHFYPWNKGTRPLSRVDAYTMGTAVVVGFPVVAMLIADALQMGKDERFWAVHLIVNAIISGITVKTAYWVDENRPVSTEEVRGNGRL